MWFHDDYVTCMGKLLFHADVVAVRKPLTRLVVQYNVFHTSASSLKAVNKEIFRVFVATAVNWRLVMIHCPEASVEFKSRAIRCW